MKKFQFRLWPLLQIRERNRDELGLEVGKALEAIRRVEAQVAEIDQQLADLRKHTAATLRDPSLAVDRMLSQGRFDLQLRSDKFGLSQTIVKLNEELTRRRGRLAEAEAEVKQLERLRESQMAEHAEEQLRRDQIEMDDRASSRYVMTRRHLP